MSRRHIARTVFRCASLRHVHFSQNGMHTLCLLDIKVKEPDFAKMARGKVAYLPPRYMTVSGDTVRTLLVVSLDAQFPSTC